METGLREAAPVRPIWRHRRAGGAAAAWLASGEADSITDFLCWPRFDSPTVFAGLLDPGRGGSFELMPELEGARTMQLYLFDTNVLVTRWLAEVASVELVDLMPYPSKDGPQRLLIRRVTVTRGSVRMRLRCHPRLDYGRAGPLARA